MAANKESFANHDNLPAWAILPAADKSFSSSS